MTKLTRTLLTVAALLISAVGSHAQDKKYAKIDDIYYELNTSDMTASVTQSWGIFNGNEYEGRGSIAIPEKITFDADTYTVTSIGYKAFSDCPKLFTVTIPESVTSIDYNAFYWCEDLTSVNLPRNLTDIGMTAFQGCFSLTTITIPEHVASIGYGAFSECSELTAINVAEGNSAFCSEEGVLYNKEKTSLLNYPAGKSGDFTVPSSVTSIQACAFSGCGGLSAVTLPEGLKIIDSGAFEYCTGLTSITIPASVTNIHIYAFLGDRNLTEFNVSEDNETYSSEDGVLYDKEMTVLKEYPEGKAGSFTIPSSVTNIERYAFSKCKQLTGITIPSSVTSIEYNAFEYCEALTTINLGEGVKSIGDFAFSACSSLTEFYSFCKIPPTVGNTSFPFYTDRITLYVPEGSLSDYQNAAEWKKFKNIRTFDTTGITDVEADTHGKNVYYDLSGRRLSAPKKGLNIINGRKVMVK